MKRKNSVKYAFSGYFAFFSVIAFTVTFAVIIYQNVSNAYNGNRKAISAIMLVVCLALSLFCTTVDALRRKFTTDRAVEEILEATEKIIRGNYKIRLMPRHSYKNYDNYDLIMENFNQMADELSKNEVLKNDFISNVSHEIKTPLAVIKNYAVALQNDKLSKDEQERHVKAILKASSRLTALVMNILKLNKLENQRIVPEFQKVRMDESLVQTIFEFEERIEQKNITLDCDIDEVTVVSEPSYLEIVWTNLLSNAIKFTPDGGKIEISLKKENEKAVVKVRDTGCGMNEETGKRIFDKFYQGDTSHAKEGNGLGLALVKRVIDLLEGDIFVESKQGEGSVFTVSFNLND